MRKLLCGIIVGLLLVHLGLSGDYLIKDAEAQFGLGRSSKGVQIEYASTDKVITANKAIFYGIYATEVLGGTASGITVAADSYDANDTETYVIRWTGDGTDTDTLWVYIDEGINVDTGLYVDTTNATYTIFYRD